MMNENIDKVKKIITSVMEEEIVLDDITDNLELYIDSITFIRIIVLIETEYDIEIPDELLLISQMNTIEKMVKAIEELL